MFIVLLSLSTASGWAEEKNAIFAGGCFWCLEPPFESLPGVKSVISGYTGGKKKNPTYQQVSMGNTGHYEAVKITYDESFVNYKELLEVFLRNIDPTDGQGQFNDRGTQYKTAVFYTGNEEKKLAEEALQQLEISGKFKNPILTEILPSSDFYPAEDYHQDYYLKNPKRYNDYAIGSGRKGFLNKVWEDTEWGGFKKPSANVLKKKLTPLQYKVTQRDGTETPFQNEYWDNKKEGIYVDIVSGEPLFSSVDKFKSGTGWPSFTQPLESRFIVSKTDRSLFSVRTEVRSRYADSHLGHVFNDGPVKEGGLRYCINSASLRFVPKDKMQVEGYGKYFDRL